MLREKSEAIYERSCRVIPGGVNSPVRAFKGLGLSPFIAESGSGALIKDADGREYIDYCLSWGPLILGHAHPAIVRAVHEQMAKGSSFGTASEIEEKMAAKVVELVPSLEKVRFVSSGTEATMTAMRLARGFTGRSKIVKFAGHYHGHSDSLLVQAGSGVASLNPIATSRGINPAVIAETLVLPFNDFEAFSTLFRDALAEQVAAVILEPVAGNMGVVPPEKGFLEFVQGKCARIGALLIFDEVITGFRVGLQGAQGYYGIDPDLSCFGKVIGGGFPIAAVGGREEILDLLAPSGEVYQAGTLSGNPVAMRAGYETLIHLERPHFYEELFQKTDRLTQPIQKLLSKREEIPVCLQQVGSMFSLFFGAKKVRAKVQLDQELFAKFFRYLFERGIYIPPSPYESWFISSAHTEEQLDFTCKAICSFFD